MSRVWVVVPAFNEAANLRIVIPQVIEHLHSIDSDGRVLVVDDGSNDDTSTVMAVLCDEYSGVAVDRAVHNRGKSAALQRGFQQALDSGASVVAMMDADGQDDPSELPRLIAELDAGWDLVTGARLKRHDGFVKRTTSRLYNKVAGAVSGAPGRDFNSGLKVMSAATAADITPMLYGELHRYIVVIAHWLGYRVTEVPVAHHERLSGSTKYGVNRFWRGFLDLMTVRFLMSYRYRPLHLFGGLGIVSLLVGLVMLVYLLVQRILGASVGERPMLIAGVLLVVVGLQVLLFGLLAELIVYTRQRPTNNQSPMTGNLDGRAR